MSRTDVHRPWPVQLADPHNRHLFYRYPMFPDSMELAPIKNIACGCTLCTGQHHRKAARRSERTWWKSHRAQTLAAARVDRDDLDVPSFPRHPW